ncbi:hypothetical protein GN244_ATG18464 [Phytophthora infestans]|uniref:Uncharacterized protein n=1 Tax=Phytophthora infestans TaxID=4787 RepID=A0A833SNY4_PHYIN|nr:hypothetical protein GN244_ATG18464 [Phytophthora infestans]
MSGVCSLVATFVVPGVGGIIVNALGNIIELCQELEENEKMCTAVYKRLQFVSEELSKISDEEAMRQNRVLFIRSRNSSSFCRNSRKRVLSSASPVIAKWWLPSKTLTKTSTSCTSF